MVDCWIFGFVLFCSFLLNDVYIGALAEKYLVLYMMRNWNPGYDVHYHDEETVGTFLATTDRGINQQ